MPWLLRAFAAAKVDARLQSVTILRTDERENNYKNNSFFYEKTRMLKSLNL
jgi:hypothetical protein